ncbi:MAG: efflux RND transporter permease subunit [Planctomycetaceae bacterium]
MSHFLEKRDRWGNSLSLWMILVAIFIVPLCFWSLRHLRMENDIDHWLPSDDPNAVTLKWSIRQFGLDSGDSIFATWDDSSLRDPRIDLLADRLAGKPDEDGVRRGGLKQVARVVTPMAVITRMVEHGVERDEAIRRLKGVLVGTGAFKIRLTESGRQRSKEVTRELLAKAKAQLGVELQVLPASRDFEATEESASVVAEAASPDSPVIEFDPIPLHDFQLRWKGKWIGTDLSKLRDLALDLKGSPTTEAPAGVSLVEACFQTPGSPVALSIVLSEAGEADLATVVKLIRQAAIEVGVPPQQLHLSGRPVATTALNDGVMSALWNRGVPASQFWRKSVIGMSALIGVLVAFTMLRSVKLTLLVLFVSYFTVFLTMALVPATGGSMNMVMVLMPTFLLVVVMSGAIHVAHYWRHAAYHHLGNAAVEASKMAGAPCLFATVTTSIGLLSLLSSSLTPARDFGIYSAIGSVIGVGAVLYLLPALIQLVPFQPPKPSDVDATKWENFGRWCCRERHWIVWGYTLATIVCVIGLNWFRTEMKVIRFFPPDAPVVQDYNFVEENLAGIVPVDVIVRFDTASQEKQNFLERMELVRNIENRMRKHREISGAIALPDFSTVTVRPAEESDTLTKIGYHRKATETERRIKTGYLAGTKLFFVVADKPHDLLVPGDAQLNQAGDELWRITAQCLVMSDADFAGLIREIHEIAESVLNPHDGTHHVVTGMVPVFLHTQQALLDSQISSFGLAYLSIMLVMIFAVRSVRAGFLTMLPNVYPIGQIFGLISYFGVAVDIGTMMTASIAMGIGVDGTLHKLTWFRKGIEEGRTREDSIALAVGHSGPAIWETSAVLALGMLMLYPADLVLISRFGWLMAAIIAVAVAGDIIFLPALLGGSLGTMIIKGVKKKTPIENAPTDSASALLASVADCGARGSRASVSINHSRHEEDREGQ